MSVRSIFIDIPETKRHVECQPATSRSESFGRPLHGMKPCARSFINHGIRANATASPTYTFQRFLSRRPLKHASLFIEIDVQIYSDFTSGSHEALYQFLLTQTLSL